MDCSRRQVRHCPSGPVSLQASELLYASNELDVGRLLAAY